MFSRFKQRSYKPERLDTGDYTLEEYEKWQVEMKRINRFLGDTKVLRRSLLNEIERETKESFSVLDVGAGSGELLREVEKWAKNTFLVGAELNEEATRSIKKNKIQSVQCNALELPFADDSFDYAISSLFLHHLDDEQVIRFLVEMNRVARKKFFVIDLHRHPVAYFLYKIFSPLFLQRFTQEDGALSILKSFQPDELKELAGRANLKNAEVKRRAVFRLVLSCEKKASLGGITLWKK
jgi:ubiquinone/menaquinone biosynthesis C-methylase UbiE